MPSLEVPDKFLWSDSRLLQDAAKRPNRQFAVQWYYTTGLPGPCLSLENNVTASLPDLQKTKPLGGTNRFRP